MTIPFGRPTGALPLGTATRLFTLPNWPGILFKQVASEAELSDIGGGVAYLSATGEWGVIHIGATMASAPVPTAICNSGNSYGWSASVLYDYGDGVTAANIPVSNNMAYQATVRGEDAAAMAARVELGLNNPASIAAGSEAIYIGNRFGNLQLTGTGLSYTSPPAMRVAVVNRADHGVLMRFGTDLRGWMSTHISLGRMKEPFNDLVKPSLLAGMSSDVAKLANKVIARWQTDGTLNAEPKIGVVTDWKSGQTQASVIKTGLGRVMPVWVGNKSSDAAHQPVVTAQLYVSNAPTVTYPFQFPVIEQFMPTGMPADLFKDIATWHKLASAYDGTLNRFKRLESSLVALSDSTNKVFGHYQAIDLLYSDLRELTIPEDPVEAAAFTPSIAIQGGDRAGIHGLYDNNLITGNYSRAWIELIQEFYLQVENEARN